jgi:hypothetical protein
LDTGKIITALGFAAGGYFAWQSGLLTTLTGGLIPAPATTGGASSPPPAPGAPPTNPTSPPPTPPPTQSLVLAAMAAATPPASGLQTFDTYNFYYNKVRGLPGPDPTPILPPDQRTKLLSADEWWGYMTKAGFNGLGMLARRGTPLGAYIPVPVGSSFGGYVQAPSLGRWIY